MSKTKTGTSIYVDDALRAPLIDFEIEGKTTQEDTPTPSNPSDLVSVGYQNLFNPALLSQETNYNSYDTSTGVWTTSSDGSYYRSIFYSAVGNNSSRDHTKLVPLEANKTYTLKLYDFINNTTYTSGIINIALYGNNDTIIGNSTDIKNYIFTFKTTQSCYLDIRRKAASGTISFSKIQIEIGELPHDFVAFNKYGIDVSTTGKNLAFSNWANDCVSRINNTERARIEEYDEKTCLRTTSNAGYPDYFNEYIFKIKFKENTRYTFQFDAKSTQNDRMFRVVYTDGTYDTISASTSWTKRFLTTQENKTVSDFRRAYYSGICYIDIDTFQVTEGTDVSEYEPYHGNSQLYTLDNPLRSIGDYKDLLYIQNGMLYVERKIGTTILDSTKNWSKAPSENFPNTFGYQDYDLRVSSIYDGDYNEGYSNYFPIKSDIDLETNNGIRLREVSNKTTISVTNLLYTDVDDFKDWLVNNNVEVQYILATPYIETLGEINILNTYKGTNSIIVHSGIETNITITYPNDFTTADKQALRNNTAAIKCKLTVLEDGDLPAIELTENNSVKDWEYSDERLVPGQGFVGQFVGRTLDGNLQNISDTFSIIGRTINLNLGIYRINDDVTTWYDFGNFVVTEPENNEVNDNTKFESMDYAKLFNKQFNGDYTDAVFTTSYNDLMGVNLSDEERATFIVTPVTARWVALYTCAQVGVTLATTDFINNDFQIDINPFQAGETCRDVMKAIGKLALSWVRIGWDNRCYIDFGIEDTVDTYDVLDNNQYFSLETVEDTIPIDGVGFGMKDIDGETAFKIKNDQPIGSAENILYVYDNPFLYTFDKRYQAVQNATAIFGLTFTQLQTETIGHPWLTGTELINVKDMEDASNYTYPFNKTIKYSGHIRSVISSVDETEVEKTLGYTSSTVQATRKASVTVNKQEGTIDLLTSRVSVVEDGLGNTYTKEETNNLVSDVAGLTNQYLTSGGANKFRNTGLWYKNDDGSGFEYWTGSVQVVNDDNSATSTAMMLQNNTLTQTLSNVPNGDYTISFKYEKLNPTSSLQILINSTDYSELLSTSGTFEQTFTVSTNSIEISFICNTNNGWKIYELMCNVGSAPLVWTQHPNEVRTDTVNISKGITITSSTTNAVFKANADGIRIENQLERTTTNFLEDGMETDNATIRKQARVSGALHTIVGNQTWISGIL